MTPTQPRWWSVRDTHTWSVRDTHTCLDRAQLLRGSLPAGFGDSPKMTRDDHRPPTWWDDAPAESSGFDPRREAEGMLPWCGTAPPGAIFLPGTVGCKAQKSLDRAFRRSLGVGRSSAPHVSGRMTQRSPPQPLHRGGGLGDGIDGTTPVPNLRTRASA